MVICAFILCVALLCLVPEYVKALANELSEKMVYEKYKDPNAITRNTKTRRSHKGWIGMEGTKIEIPYNQPSKTNETSQKQETINEIKVIDSNSELLKMDNSILAIKVAALFRNNLIRVFGYVLHRPQMELNSELYTSLYFILSTIKLNQVNILSMIPILKEIAFKTSNERFLKIFEEMEKHLPMYLRCAAVFWKDAIQKKEVNMDNILKPTANGPLKVDILEGMNDEILGKLANDETMEGPKNKNEEKVLYNFNTNIVEIMRYIQKHKNNIHQLFFGALVLFFPRSVIQPDLEESVQILIEFLQQNELEQWKHYISLLDTSKTENPYFVVNEILKKLIADNSTTTVIKESLQIILNNLVNRNPTAINPHYNSITSFVELDKIKIQYMMNYIGNGAYPLEITIARDRIDYHLSQNHIRHLTLMTHFNPYIYSSPTEIMISLLDRIIKRQPDLPAQIIDAVGAVYSYQIFTYRFVVLPATMPDDVLNLNILFLGVRSPVIEESFVKNVNTIINLFSKEQLNFQKILLEIPVYKCATPMDCFMELLKHLNQMKLLLSPEIMKLLIVILNTNCYRVQCALQPPSANDMIPPPVLEEIYNGTNITISSVLPEITTPLSTTTISTTTLSTTTIKITPPPTEGPISTPTTLKPTSATPPTTLSVGTVTPANVTEAVPTNPSAAIITIIQQIAPEAEAIFVQQILKVMASAEFKAEYGKLAKGSQLVLITTLMQYLELVQTKMGGQLETHIRQFLITFMKKVKHIEDVLKLITSEKQPTRPVLARLIVAVPAPADNETAVFNQLSLLLQKEELFTLIVDNIQKENYKNIGVLLKAVLHEELKLKDKLNEEEINAAKYYVNKIQLHGFGQGKILWGVDVDIISQNINVAQIMDHAMSFTALDNEKRKQFNSIIVYMRRNPPILQTWDKWIYYTKCGDFTKALFHLLVHQANTPPNVVTAITVLTPLINYDKNGQKPTFGKSEQ